MIFLHELYTDRLKELNSKSWSYCFKKQNKQSLIWSYQFFYFLNKYQNFIDSSRSDIKYLLRSQNILRKCYDSNNYIHNKDYILIYDLDEDTNEVTNFEAILNSPSKVNIDKMYEHIDYFFEHHISKKHNVPITFEYDKQYKNKTSISFDVNYEMEGLIHIDLDDYGYLKGDTLFLLEDNINTIEIFVKKFNELYQYFSQILK